MNMIAHVTNYPHIHLGNLLLGIAIIVVSVLFLLVLDLRR